MPDEPLTIARPKLFEFIAALGVETEPRHIRSITITPKSVTVVRYRLTAAGHHVFVGPDGAATETIVIAIGGEA